MNPIGRHTWVNTIVGILDGAFALTDEERFFTQDIVRKLLAALRIPERGRPEQLPAAVASEAEAGLYTLSLYEPRDAGVVRHPRTVRPGDTVVTLEAWRQALVTLLADGYPDLDAFEVVMATKTFDDLLVALGVPSRAAAFLPEDVVRAHLQGA